MAIKLTTTKESTDYVKCLIYAESKVGKTWLCKTAPSPLIISSEKGLLALKKENIPVISISSFDDLEDAYFFIMNNNKAEKFQTICLDSISDIAETILSEEKKNCGSDPRKAYGSYQDKLLPIIKKFRDISNKHVYFTAKLKRTTDEDTGKTCYGPSMPGRQLGPDMPYLFDFCFVLKIGKDDDGKKFRYLQTQPDLQYIAGSRSDELDEIETPDLTYIFNKALGKKSLSGKESTISDELVENTEIGPKLEIITSIKEHDKDSKEVKSSKEIVGDDFDLIREEAEADMKAAMKGG